MGKKIIICFDGTCNDPEDANQEQLVEGRLLDNSITNVFKLHLLLGGGLKDEQAFGPEQISLYYPGVGTYGGIVRRIFNAALAPNNADVGRIINRAGEDLKKIYKKEDGDEIFLFGFSRGAAIARRFAAVVREKYIPHMAGTDSIRFMGLFDTVASIGFPNLNRHDQPRSDVVFENNRISPLVKEALHLLALDEKRLAFRPTLMEQEKRVTEVWFPGAHGDVGGGYAKDGLSDVALTFMLSELTRRGLGLQTRIPEDLNYKAIDTEDVDLDYEDMIIEPNPLGPSHQQNRKLKITKSLLADRELPVDGNPPIIHHSVVERIVADTDYRPASLGQVTIKIVDDSCNVINDQVGGLKGILKGFTHMPTPLAQGEKKQVIVQSHIKHNRTYIFVEKGKQYSFEISPGQKWQDGGISCGPEGWNRATEQLGLVEILIDWQEERRRNPNADWFELVGVIGDDKGEKVRPIKIMENQNNVWSPQSSGELVLYANDVDKRYNNNIGNITVTIKKL